MPTPAEESAPTPVDEPAGDDVAPASDTPQPIGVPVGWGAPAADGKVPEDAPLADSTPEEELVSTPDEEPALAPLDLSLIHI